jgi:SAM-dependent methyltransferase
MSNKERSDGFLAGCRVCGSGDLGRFTAKEMMFGNRREFLYVECQSCGCVQIAEYLDNIADHYPETYYSFQDSLLSSPDKANPMLKRILRPGKRALMRWCAPLRHQFLNSRATRHWLRSRPVAALYLKYVPDPDKKILDVGCGSGGLLISLDALYYRNLHGADPFISNDVYFHGRLLVKRANMPDLRPHYDCISFHHVLEHMPNQLAALQDARALLASDGLVMVRIPVVGGVAWRTYRENWVQLDPPRHYYLHSENSFRMLAEQAGFNVSSIEYDSTGFQFWGSELYLRGIPLMGTGRPEDSKDAIFSPDKLAEYDARAAELNQSRDGDQIVAILRKKG